jgi:hypothetical protein
MHPAAVWPIPHLPMKQTAFRLSRLARTALPSAPLALAAIPSAHAAIIYTDAGDVTFSFSDSKFLWVDMGTAGSPGAAALGAQDHYHPTITSPSFYLWFRYSGNRPEWVSNDAAFTPGPGRVFDGVNNSVAINGNYVALLNVGDVVSGSLSLTSNYRPFRTTGTNGSPWATPETTGYIGVEFNTNTTPLFGWVQISYNANQSITVHDFAYESSGGAITIIPESSTFAALAGLLAGSAALYAKRRKRAA